MLGLLRKLLSAILYAVFFIPCAISGAAVFFLAAVECFVFNALRATRIWAFHNEEDKRSWLKLLSMSLDADGDLDEYGGW